MSLACGWIASRIVEVIAPVEHARADYRGGVLEFSVDPDYDTARRRGIRAGTYYDVTASALAYSYGLPFFLALGYQLGSLIFPPLAPVLLWIALDWRAVRSLALDERGVRSRAGP